MTSVAVFVLLLATSIWIGGFVAIAIVARVARPSSTRRPGSPSSAGLDAATSSSAAARSLSLSEAAAVLLALERLDPHQDRRGGARSYARARHRCGCHSSPRPDAHTARNLSIAELCGCRGRAIRRGSRGSPPREHRSAHLRAARGRLGDRNMTRRGVPHHDSRGSPDSSLLAVGLSHRDARCCRSRVGVRRLRRAAGAAPAAGSCG